MESPRSEENRDFWRLVLTSYKRHAPIIGGTLNPQTGDFIRVACGNPKLNYHWWIRRHANTVQVGLTFRSDSEQSAAWLKQVLSSCPHLADIGNHFDFGTHYGQKARLWFDIPYGGHLPSQDNADEAARLMVTLIDRTLPIVKSL